MHDVFLDFDLPERLIAQAPVPERDQARLLTVDRARGAVAHRVFADLPELLDPGDLLVLNDTQVLPARLLGVRVRTGGKWEGLFLRQHPDGLWELIGQTRGRPTDGEEILLHTGLRLTMVGRTPDRHWLLRPEASGTVPELLAQHGQVPLPPYIRKGRAVEGDRERYQTVYARQAGAVAAPTAGLHFTPRLFERLEQRGISRTFLTLHVGLGTFRPLQSEDYTQHVMHREWGEYPAQAAADVAACKARGNRVVAVGTTAVRVLETVATAGGLGQPWSGETSLYVYPPYRFRAVDALVTNFHLPRSTLLLLVGAFTGVDLLRTAYKTAVEGGYRFFSYGDAMLIL